MTEDSDGFALPDETAIGGVCLRVGSIDRVVPFYRDAIGLEVERDGDRARLLAGDTALVELLEAPDAPERGRADAGLFHVAIRIPDREALADGLSRIRRADARLSGASDHLVSEALYLQDPEGNGVELYRDRPRSAWPRGEDGRIGMDTLPLDLDDLAANARDRDRLPEGTDVGHVHLEVTDLARAEGFYDDDVGLAVQARYGDDATFLAAGGYHHHVGLNTWNGRTEPAGEGRGLAWFELVVPDGDALDTLRSRLSDRGHRLEDGDGGAVLADYDGLRLRLSTDRH